MMTAALIHRPIKIAPRTARTAQISASPAGRPARRLTCLVAAKQDLSIFESARRELGNRVMNSRDTGEITWAAKLRSALNQYLKMEDALDAQRATPGRVGKALAEVLAMASEAPTPPTGPSDKSQVWQALVLAGQLRGGELAQARPKVLPPRFPATYETSETWNLLAKRLDWMDHDAWPADVVMWIKVLMPALEAYVAHETRFSKYAPSSLAVDGLLASLEDVSRHLDPPQGEPGPEVPVRQRMNWESERNKKLFTDLLDMCRCALTLRRTELHDLAGLLASD